jgi:hypothetical protein
VAASLPVTLVFETQCLPSAGFRSTRA